MIIRNYLVDDIKTSLFWCPSCHKKIEFPIKGNVVIKDSLNLLCLYPDCRKGKVVVKVKQKELVETK